MKMILFRPTFLTAGMLFHTLALLCVLLSVSSVSAVPQFGRPMFHALNDEPVPSKLAEPFFAASTDAMSSGEPTPTASVSDEPVSTANATASSTTMTATPSAAGGSTSGASHHFGGGAHAALLLSAAVSVVFFAC